MEIGVFLLSNRYIRKALFSPQNIDGIIIFIAESIIIITAMDYLKHSIIKSKHLRCVMNARINFDILMHKDLCHKSRNLI